MKAVILAGGMQSSINSEREGIPKPMVEIGGKPLLWHIMKHFSQYGINEFIVCGGYRVDIIKEYFMDFYIYESDITVDLQNNTVKIHKNKTEDWKVTVVNTGLSALTGERVQAIEKYVGDEDFIVAYGDCLTNMDISALIAQHKKKQKTATISMARPIGRDQLLPVTPNGTLHFSDGKSSVLQDAWVNADYFVFSKKIFQYLQDCCDLEKGLLIELSDEGQLATYRHDGYWIAIETKRDLVSAEKLWKSGTAPWIDL